MAYSDAEVGEALITLAQNRYNYQKTAEQTGFNVRTLRRWDKSVPKKGVIELLERAIERLLMRIDEIPADDLAVAIGILMDKWILAQGGATSRNESIIKSLSDLPDDDKSAIITEAERILARATGGGANIGAPISSTARSRSLALARFAPRPMDDSEPSGEGEGSSYGAALGEVGHG